MSYQVILASVNGGETDGFVVRAALALAREFNGHVDALCITPPVEDEVPLLARGLPESVIQDMTRLARGKAAARRDTARQAFERAIASVTGLTVGTLPRRDGPSAAWREVGGDPEALLPREGRKADLIVAGHPADASQRRIVEATLLGSGRPLLLLPPGAPSPLGRSVAVAWNGSVEATRAVAASLPLLHRADSVFVLSAGDPRLDEHDCAGLDRYLSWNGVDSRVVPVCCGLDDPGPALLRQARELGVDVVVMGAYGYNRLRELAFGGVTRFALRHPQVALLLAH